MQNSQKATLAIQNSLLHPIPHIYFDWNAIQDLKQDIFEKIDFDKNAQEKWQKFLDVKKKYKVPLSEAHCKDLGKTTQKEWVDIDLNFLEKHFIDDSWIFEVFFTDTIRLYLAFSSENIKDDFEKISDIKSFYEFFKNRDKFPKNEINIFHSDVKIDLDGVHDSNVLKKHIIENDGFLNGKVLESFIEEWRLNNKNKEFIKMLRGSLLNLSLVNNPVYRNYKNPEKFEYLIKGFIDFIGIEDSNINSHKDFIEKYLEFSNVDASSISLRIFIVFSLLNLTPEYGDKYKKKNQPSNTEADMYHVMAAWRSSYFVTKDGGLKNKIHAINKLLDLNINVITLDELLLK